MENQPGWRVKELWAYVLVDKNGNEGVVRRETPIGTQPLIGDDFTRMLTFPIGEEAARIEKEAREGGGRLKLVRFVKDKEYDPAFKPGGGIVAPGVG